MTEMWTVFGVGGVWTEQIRQGQGRGLRCAGAGSQDWAQPKAKFSVPRRAPRDLRHCFIFRTSSNFLLGSVLTSKSLWLKGTLRNILDPFELGKYSFKYAGFEDWRLVEKFIIKGYSNPQRMVLILEFKMETRTLFYWDFLLQALGVGAWSLTTLDRIYLPGSIPCT